jgi:hypothetical protein
MPADPYPHSDRQKTLRLDRADRHGRAAGRRGD